MCVCVLHLTYVHAYILTYIHAYVHTCMHTYIHTYKHIYIQPYIHTYTYAQRRILIAHIHMLNSCAYCFVVCLLCLALQVGGAPTPVGEGW